MDGEPTSDQIDYRMLLVKYMKHVGNESGSVYLSGYISAAVDGFSEAEVAILEELDMEALALNRARSTPP